MKDHVQRLSLDLPKFIKASTFQSIEMQAYLKTILEQQSEILAVLKESNVEESRKEAINKYQENFRLLYESFIENNS